MATIRYMTEKFILNENARIVLNPTSFYGKPFSKLSKSLRKADKRFHSTYVDSCLNYRIKRKKLREEFNRKITVTAFTPKNPLAIVSRVFGNLRFIVNIGVHTVTRTGKDVYSLEDLDTALEVFSSRMREMPAVVISVPMYKDSYGTLDHGKVYDLVIKHLSSYPGYIDFYFEKDADIGKYAKITKPTKKKRKKK